MRLVDDWAHFPICMTTERVKWGKLRRQRHNKVEKKLSMLTYLLTLDIVHSFIHSTTFQPPFL